MLNKFFLYSEALISQLAAFISSLNTLINCSIFFSLAIIPAMQANAATVFINEFHYDNIGTDINEGVEIIGTAGTNLNNWSIQFYNGGNGSVYKTTALTGILSDQNNGFGVLSFAISGLQNGEADGLALVDNGQLIEFISYEGSLLAVDGAAAGQTSTDVGVQQTTSTAVGQSIQRIGTGHNGDDFSWEVNTASFGIVNAGQTINAVVPLPAPIFLYLGALATLALPKLKTSI